ncbi:MAG: calcium-binding protein [Pseudorhodoplanes sp.]|nr:calcium-binding protein [Pseudorhodoplanes sp.]
MARKKIYDWFFPDNSNVLYAPGSEDYEMLGYGGGDAIYGGIGSDVIKGGDGKDLLFGGDGNDTVEGGEGDDTIYIDRGNNVYDGGSGYDIFSFMKIATYVSVNPFGAVGTSSIGSFDIGFSLDLWSGETRSQVKTGPQGTISTEYSDFWGTNTYDNFQHYRMGNGNDIVRGNNAGHKIEGFAGNDTIEGRGGADTIDGGAGTDTASYEGSSAGVTVNLATGFTQGGDAAGDRLSSIENLTGSAHRDVLTGNIDDNRIDAGRGNDDLFGGDGNDTLNGGDDQDILVGGKGKDIMSGGNGADVFKFNSVQDTGNTAATRDVITDFDRFMDTIDLTAIDADSTTKAFDRFDFIGASTFSGEAGELRVGQTLIGGEIAYIVQGDRNGDRVADFAIEVHSNGALQANDFLLPEFLL